MCGFSSGSHFSTAFGALFGNTPREERQRKLMLPDKFTLRPKVKILVAIRKEL
jgi:AraC-like DNA-binding protein